VTRRRPARGATCAEQPRVHTLLRGVAFARW
jgi:hypothetical protein